MTLWWVSDQIAPLNVQRTERGLPLMLAVPFAGMRAGAGKVGRSCGRPTNNESAQMPFCVTIVGSVSGNKPRFAKAKRPLMGHEPSGRKWVSEKR